MVSVDVAARCNTIDQVAAGSKVSSPLSPSIPLIPLFSENPLLHYPEFIQKLLLTAFLPDASCDNMNVALFPISTCLMKSWFQKLSGAEW